MAISVEPPTDKDRLDIPGISLTSKMDFSWMKKNEILKVKVEHPQQNMQSDEAAFEGWSLALKSSNKICLNKVILDWCPHKRFVADHENEPVPLPAEDLHYNRFLFRVDFFCRMFPGWFEVDVDRLPELQEFMENLFSTPLLMSLATRSAHKADVENEGQKITEHLIESLFANEFSCLLIDKYGLEAVNVQLPVGVFENEVKKIKAVFNYSRSAIDLWGLNRETGILHIFELKIDSNYGLGIISEILFYLALMQETIGPDARIKFDSTRIKDNKSHQRGARILINSEYTALKGVLLVDKIHPLLESAPKWLKLVNDGLQNVGDMSVEWQRYQYDSPNIIL